MQNLTKQLLPLIVLTLFASIPMESAVAQKLDYKPKVLVVTAHPDDDALFAATIYKITHVMGGTVDLALLTNGEGGYKYSTLSEDIYGLNLDKEEVGRAYLPGIRKKELIAGGRIMGLRQYYFFEQVDDQYTQDVSKPLSKWDTTYVMNKFKSIFREENYDYMFVLLPIPTTHGHHQASAILALRSVQRLPEDKRPVVLGGFSRAPGDSNSFNYSALPDYPVTKPDTAVDPFEVDRRQKFGHKDRLNFDIIRSWVIAEHKSQGTMQLYMNSGRIEQFRYMAMNPDDKLEKTRTFFEAVKAAVPTVD